MKASKAQAQINKQTKAMLNVLVFMLRESGMEEEQIQRVMAGNGILNLNPIAPNKKPKRTALEVAVDTPEQTETVEKPDSRNMSVEVDDDSGIDSYEPNQLASIDNNPKKDKLSRKDKAEFRAEQADLDTEQQEDLDSWDFETGEYSEE